MPEAQVSVTHDPANELLEVSYENVHLETTAQIDAGFQMIRAYWQRHCKGKRMYVLVNYTGFSIEPTLMDYYGEQVKAAVTDITIAAIRFSEQLSVRTQVRAMAIKIQRASATYATRAEALAVLKGLREKSIAIEMEPSRA